MELFTFFANYLRKDANYLHFLRKIYEKK